MLGGGREKKEDAIDHGVEPGIPQAHRRSRAAGEKLVTIHYNSDAKLAEAEQMVAASFVIGEAALPC